MFTFKPKSFRRSWENLGKAFKDKGPNKHS